jgi:hypothetical protein
LNFSGQNFKYVSDIAISTTKSHIWDFRH